MTFDDEKNVELHDETIIAGDVPAEGEVTEEKEKGKEDDTSKDAASKKEVEEANVRMKRLEDGQRRLTEVFTSPEFFSKLASSMKPIPKEEVKAEPTLEQIQSEKQKLEDMDRQEFLSHTLSKVTAAASAAIKPEVEKLATQMSTFISGQANLSAEGKVKDFIDRVGQAEFNKHGAAMEAKAKATSGINMDELYTLVSGKKAPTYVKPIIPNKTLKPGEGTRELTEQKDLPMDKAASRNFDNIFGKSKK